MALNVDSMNSFDEIANIIPSPINNANKELFIEGDSKLGKVEKEIDSFADISGISEDNNEIANDKSLLNIKIKEPKNTLQNDDPLQNLEIKIKNFFENCKINKLPSSTKNNFNLNINSKSNINENNKQNINNFGFINVKKNNELKYNILFDKNKKLNINSLREEYSKIKNDKKYNQINQNQNNRKIVNRKKYLSIFNDYEKKHLENKNLNFDIFNFKRNNRINRYCESYNNYDYEFKNYYKTKTNNNSKDNRNKEKPKINLLGNDLFNSNNKLTYSVFNKNSNTNKNNIINFDNDYINKSIKNNNNKNNIIFNSLRKNNKTSKLIDENDSWLLNSNNKNENYIFNIYNSNSNLEIKYNFKTKSIFDKLKLNKNNPEKTDFNYITPKSNFIDFKNINNLKNNKKSLINRYYQKNNEYYYNLTNEENKNNNNNYNSIKRNKISFNTIMDNNEDILDKFSNNFEAIFNYVKQKNKNINNYNFRYNNNLNFKKITPKYLSISQNEPKKLKLTKLFKENNKNKYLKAFKLPTNNLNFKKNEEKISLKKLIKKNSNNNHFSISNYSYNGDNYFKMQNNRKKFLNI